jgi:hypothetical protein
MPSAAGVIIATGVMTAINKPLSSNQPLSAMAGEIDWKIVPATAFAAGVFYGLEQAFGKAAVGLAWLAFFTAFMTGYTPSGGIPGINLTTSPLGTLMNIFGYKLG